MAAILNFTHSAMFKLLSGYTTKSAIPNQRQISKSWSTFYFVSKIISIDCFDLAQMAAILKFTHNTMADVRSGHTPMSDMLGTLWYTPNLGFCYYSVKNDINLLFDLAQMTPILDYIHSAIFKALSDYTTSLCQE